MGNIKVLLADDHTIVRKGLRSLLEDEDGIEVIGEAEDGREAIKLAEKLHPDIVLMDIAMQGLNGLEATRQLKRLHPEIKILILSMYANEEYVFQTLQAGAEGYLVKKAAPSELVLAIKSVHQGNSFLSPSISRTVIDEYIRRANEIDEGDDAFKNLTARETEVLQLIAEGRKTREIAELLYISIKTVETHRSHIMDKLGIHSTAELTQYAISKGIISSDA
jgi:DNA-binding NarL/FixJ family response regulator